MENIYLIVTFVSFLCFEEFNPHVRDINQHCLHSLRSGGATAAANK